MVKLTRKFAGEYEYQMYGHTFVISRNDERDSTWYGEWIIKWGTYQQHYGDPIPTLARCRLALKEMEENPVEYGLVKHD